MAWPKAMPIVEVEWLDSHSQDRWQHTDDLDQWLRELTLLCRTVGYLYLESEDRVVITQSQSATGSIADAMVIPKAAVRSMTTLKAMETEQVPITSKSPFSVAVDVAGMPYCADCGDSGSGPCQYHYRETQRRLREA